MNFLMHHMLLRYGVKIKNYHSTFEDESPEVSNK